nr:hypothetical protein [Acidisphaera sp. S103]
MGGDAADFEFGSAKVDREAKQLAGRPWMVSALRDMRVAQRADELEFDDELILDYEVGGIFADKHVVVKDYDSPLLQNAESGLSHLMRKGFLVDLFNESVTERISNPKSSPNDPFGDRLPQSRIPFIHLHPANPP